MNKISLCERCAQPIDSGPYIMIPSQSGTWTERVDGSPAGPGDLHCCYDCSEQLEPPWHGDGELPDDSPVLWPADIVPIYIYYLLRDGVSTHLGKNKQALTNQTVVYVGISKDPGGRIIEHWEEERVFDDTVENGPYTLAEALRREKALIKWYRPIYNTVHRGDYYHSRTYDPSLELMTLEELERPGRFSSFRAF